MRLKMARFLRCAISILIWFNLAEPSAAADEPLLDPKLTIHSQLDSQIDAQIDRVTASPSNTELTVAKYRGHKQSRKFHRHSCPYGRIISPTNKIEFPTRRDACSDGYAPCKVCLPPTWTKVRAVLYVPAN